MKILSFLVHIYWQHPSRADAKSFVGPKTKTPRTEDYVELNLDIGSRTLVVSHDVIPELEEARDWAKCGERFWVLVYTSFSQWRRLGTNSYGAMWELWPDRWNGDYLSLLTPRCQAHISRYLRVPTGAITATAARW